MISDFDRDGLHLKIRDQELESSRMLHFTNNTLRFWDSLDKEAIDMRLNIYEKECFSWSNNLEERKRMTDAKIKQSVIHDNMIPYKAHFPGVTQMFMPYTGFRWLP